MTASLNLTKSTRSSTTEGTELASKILEPFRCVAKVLEPGFGAEYASTGPIVYSSDGLPGYLNFSSNSRFESQDCINKRSKMISQICSRAYRQVHDGTLVGHNEASILSIEVDLSDGGLIVYSMQSDKDKVSHPSCWLHVVASTLPQTESILPRRINTCSNTVLMCNSST